MDSLKNTSVKGLRFLEKYTKTDMVYLAKGSFWINANTVVITIFSFILSVTFAKYVSKDLFGMYQFIISISSIIGSLTLVGMNSSVTQAVARGFEGVFNESIKVQLKFGIIPFIIGSGISLYYLINGNNLFALCIIIISIMLPITSALNTWTAYLSGKKEFKNLFIFGQIVNFSYYLGLILVIFLFPNLVTLILFGFSSNLLFNFFVYKLINKKYKPNTQSEQEALSYGKKLSFSSILPMISLHIDNIIIFHFLGPVQLAIYAFASNIPERLGGLLRPISTLAMPKLSTKDPSEVSRIISIKTFQFFIVVCVSGLIYVLVAPFIFNIFFKAYTDSILYSQIYAIAIVLSVTASLPVTSIFATRSKKIFTFNIINPIFNILIISTLTYLFGIWGAIYGRIIGNSFYLISSIYLSKKID